MKRINLRKGKELDRMIVSLSLTIREVVQYYLNKNKKGVVFLVDPQDRLAGVVTDGDIRRSFAAGIPSSVCVSEIMSRTPVYYNQSTDISIIFSLLSERYKYIPVVDDEGKIVGYYSYYDKSIPVAKPEFKVREFEYVMDCLARSWISSKGKYIDRFENSFAEVVGSKYSLSVSNGTSALHLALAALGIGKGDEVIVPSFTFIATANAVSYTGAKPVFVDSEMDTWNIDPALIEEVITGRTKAIIPVHLYGQPSKMDEIKAIAKKHSLYVIEDSAEAHGALYKGKPVGSLADAGCFSFFGNKIITTGEGGMLVTSNQDLYEKARVLRDHGMDLDKKYWHKQIGFNYRMTNLQAAVGLAQIERIDEILARKSEIAQRFRMNLTVNKTLILPPQNDWSSNVYWTFSIVLNRGRYAHLSRQGLINILESNNVETRPLFYPIHTMPPYYESKSLKICEFLSAGGVSLPSYPGLTMAEVDRICGIINNAGRV